MKSTTIAFVLIAGFNIFALVTKSEACKGLTLVSRKEWGAKTVRGLTRIPAVSHVFIHHTTGGRCTTKAKCSSMVRGMQNYHINTNKWSDIGYSFLIGGDGRVYVGRGWGIQGAHTYRYNSVGIGIAFIGDFTKTNAPSNMISAAKKLIACGVKAGKIKRNYKLHGHRDVYATECPGNKLYAEIKKWPHYHRKA